MTIETQLALLVNTKEDLREALGLSIDEPFAEYPNVIESKKVDVVQSQGFSKVKVMSQHAVTNAISAIAGYVGYATGEYSGEYGLEWDSVKDTYQRTGVREFTAIQNMMKRCVLNEDGTVNYFLDRFNSNYKADGTPAVLDGTDGNVMVQVPKFYVKYGNEGVKRSMSVSLGVITDGVVDRTTPPAGYVVHPAFIKGGVEVDFRYYRAYKGFEQGGKLRSVSGVLPTRSKTLPAFRTIAEANGAGWHQTDWNLLNAIRTLLFIEFGSFDAQKALGNGNHLGSVYAKITGASNKRGNLSSSPDTIGWMSYRGIENFYAEAWEWVDGVNVKDREVFVNGDYTTFASDVFTPPYVSTGKSLPASSYIKDMYFDISGIIPTLGGGTSATYITDYVYSAATTDNVMAFGGGAAYGGLLCGASCFGASGSSASAASANGAGVSF